MIKTALAFSGGKDSWACLWLLRDRLHEIEVVWVNTGKNYPEILETIEKARLICPNFTEIKSDKEGQNDYYGLPSDVVPVNWTRLGQSVTENKQVMVQAYMFCCYQNIGLKVQQYCIDHGITDLYRGQRNDEGHKSEARDGTILDGIILHQPIESWTAEQVLEFNALHMVLPDHFKFKHSSMDCYDCTAYDAESVDRIEYMRTNHSELYSEYKEKKIALNKAIIESVNSLLEV